MRSKYRGILPVSLENVFVARLADKLPAISLWRFNGQNRSFVFLLIIARCTPRVYLHKKLPIEYVQTEDRFAIYLDYSDNLIFSLEREKEEPRHSVRLYVHSVTRARINYKFMDSV